MTTDMKAPERIAATVLCPALFAHDDWRAGSNARPHADKTQMELDGAVTIEGVSGGEKSAPIENASVYISTWKNERLSRANS